MYRAQIRVLEQMDEKRLGRLLQRLDGLALPPETYCRRVWEDIAAYLAD